MTLGLAFWRARVLLTAVELGVFDALCREPQSLDELVARLGLHGRGAADFFDALVMLGLLEREGGRYRNGVEADRFLVAHRPWYIGSALELASDRLYATWGRLTEALRTGLPQNEAHDEGDYYTNLGRDSDRLRGFLSGMSGLSRAASRAIALKFPWASYNTFLDVGGAQGELSIQVALAHRHVTGATFDLPHVAPFFAEHVAAFGLEGRLRFHSGEFFADPLPSAEVFIMGHVLHNWGLDQKRLLIRKAYDALPSKGALIVHEALIDDGREENIFGVLMSLNMLLVTRDGSVFTGAECQRWMRACGFRETRVEHLAGPDFMVIATK